MAIKEQHEVIIASIKRQAYNSNQKRERGKKSVVSLLGDCCDSANLLY